MTRRLDTLLFVACVLVSLAGAQHVAERVYDVAHRWLR